MLNRRLFSRATLFAAVLFAAACDETNPPIDPDPDGVAELTGVVTLEQRAPVEGATIRLHGAGETIEGTSDASGEFELSEIPPGSYTVEVVPPSGYALRTLDQASVALAADQHVDLTIDLGAAASAGSLVVEVQSDGLPVAGIEVNVMQLGPAVDTLALDTIGTADTDANGRAIFAVDAGPYVVEIRTPPGEYSVDGIRKFGINVLDGTVTWVGFELYTGNHEPPTYDDVQVTGRVSLNELDPVAGVHVELHREDLVIDATSDALGNMNFGAVTPGMWLVQVDVPPAYSLADGQDDEFVLFIAETDSMARVDIALANAAGEGRLETFVWGDSVFIQGADLTVYEQGTTNVVATGTTGANGRWNPLVAPGTYTVVLDVPDGWTLLNGGSATQENIVVNAGRRTYSSFYLTHE